jgi:hypothetical protein
MNALMSERQEEYYARIVPILGDGLRQARIAVCGVAAVAGAVERLAGCRALRWWVADDTPLAPAHPLARGSGAPPGAPAGAALAAALRSHNEWEDGWAFRQRPALTAATYGACVAELDAAPPDLLLGGGDAETLARLAALARRLNVPALLVAHFAGDDPAAALLALLPGDGNHGREWPDLLAALGHPPLRDPAMLPPDPAARHAWADANGLAALLAKALLTHGTPHAAPDLDHLLWRERRTAAVLGASGWPWTVHYANLATAGRRPGVRGQGPGARGQGSEATTTQHAARNTQHATCNTAAARSPQSAVLIVGCGSLGSLAARELAASGAARDLVLVDGDTVDAANPVRQFFHTGQVGQPKAVALARNLAALAPPGTRWTESAPTHGPGLTLTSPAGTLTALARDIWTDRAALAGFRRLLAAARPAAAVLATGSHVDHALARVLRAENIPHVIGRCYPRARYFEAIVVDGQRGPCFGCLRGHLYTGPAPSPTLEETLRYDLPVGEGDLAGEPATVVESGRAADVLARLAAGLARPAAQRPPWLAALLAHEQTCLIGGNTAQAVRGGALIIEWAYGVRYPGQVVAFGAAQVLGTGATQHCPDCGRTLPVRYAL